MANHGISSQRQRGLLLDLALAGARGMSVRGLYERLTRLVGELCPGTRVAMLVPEPATRTYAVLSDQPLPLPGDLPPLSLRSEASAVLAAVAERMGFDDSAPARLVPIPGEAQPSYLVAQGAAGAEADGLCKAVTEIFAAALAREAAAIAAERSARRAAALHDLALLLHQGKQVESLFDRLLAVLDGALQCDFAGLLRPGASPGVFDSIASSDIPELNRTSWTPEIAQVDRVIAAGEPVTQWRPDRIGGAAPAAMAAAGIKMVATALLRSEGEVIGLFSVGRRSGARFADEECQFIEQVAALLSQAVAGSKRVEAATAAAARAHTLAELALLLNANEPLERLFERLPDGMRRGIEFDYVGLALPSSTPEMFQVVQSGLGRAPSVVLERARTGWDTLLAKGRDVAQLALADEEGGLIPSFLRAGMRRSLVAILRYRGEPLGLLHLSRAKPEPFSDDEVAFLNVLCTLFAQALANQQRVQQAETEAHRQRLLNQLSLLVNQGEPTGTVFGRVKTLIQEAVDVDFVGLVVTRPEDDMAELISADRVAPEGPRRLVPLDASGIPQVVATGERVLQFEPKEIDLPICQQLAGRGIAHAASVVLRDGTVPIGMLTFGRRRKSPFQGEDTALMDLVATLLGQAVATQLRMRRTKIEAEDQALIGAIGAAAATETDPGRLVQLLNEELRKRLPEAIVGFGFLEGDSVVYPMPNWQMYRQPVGPATRRAEAEGQVVGRWSDGLVLPESPMYGVGLQVAALTVARLSGSTVGFLLVATKAPGYRFSERELRLFRLLAQLVGPAVQNLRAAAQIARERALYDLALQSLSEAVVLVDHDLRAVFANAGGEALVEAVRSNRDDKPGALPDIEAYARRVFREALQFGVRHRGLTQLEVRGELVWLEFEAIPLEHPAFRLLVVASDVSAKVRREAEERRHREELDEASRRTEADRALRNLILDSLSEAVILVEEEGLRVAYANPHGRELVERIENGRSLDHLQELLDFLPEEAREHFRAAFEAGRPAAFRGSLDFNGEVRWYDVELIPVRLEQPQLLIVAADVTSAVQREAELQQHRERMEQAARLAALGELISGVAHELNNPL
ncbi:MAG: GAF domain-containing protein, partial [Hyphomicrobiales bacterium]